jgi:hypothetical protein
MFESFIDESGKGNTLIISAYVVRSGPAHRFAKTWNEVLDRYKVDYWHSKDFRSSKSKLFRHLTKSKRKDMLLELVAPIKKRFSYGITVEINISEYEAMTSPRFRSQWGSKYTWGVNMVFLSLSKHLEADGCNDEVVNVLIEKGHSNLKQAIEHVERFKNPKNAHVIRVGNVGDGHKKDNAGLQAADMLAYGSYEELRKLKRKPEIFGRLVANPAPKHVWMSWNPVLVELGKQGVEALYRDEKFGDLTL